MKLSDKMINRLVQAVFKDLKSQNTVIFKADEAKVFDRACELIREEFHKEAALDAEVNRMMDQLERDNPGQFQRFKMFPLLKKKLAKEKGVVL